MFVLRSVFRARVLAVLLLFAVFTCGMALAQTTGTAPDAGSTTIVQGAQGPSGPPGPPGPPGPAAPAAPAPPTVQSTSSTSTTTVVPVPASPSPVFFGLDQTTAIVIGVVLVVIVILAIVAMSREDRRTI